MPGATRATTPSFGSTRSGRPAPRTCSTGCSSPFDRPRGAALQALKPLLIERTEGNPFFLEESVRALVEAGVLIGERGAYHLVRPAEEIRVPGDGPTVLAARIDRLAPEDKRLLQTAAVVGKDVPFALLDAIATVPEADLRAALARLQSAELLYAGDALPELELTFKHALTHEVTYGGLLQERRRTLHAQIVDAIERLYPDRLDEHVEPGPPCPARRGLGQGRRLRGRSTREGAGPLGLRRGGDLVSARAQRACATSRHPSDPRADDRPAHGNRAIFESAGANGPLLEQYVIAETIARAIKTMLGSARSTRS